MNPFDPQSPEEFLSVAHFGEKECIIEKSRFIGYTQPVTSEKDAHDFVVMIRHQHPQATHVCSAYIVGKGGLSMRFSDDGEPSGTAGVPMLEVLKKAGLTDVVIAVVRYFGGVKLGAGGLIRAYTKGATLAIEAGEITTWTRHKALTLTVAYTFQGTVSHYLEQKPWLLTDTTYDADVHYHLYIPAEECAQAEEDIQNWCNGQALCDWGDLSYQGKRII